MEQENSYEIYTDASFDAEIKLGTYAIVIMKKKKIVKVIAKKIGIPLQNSTECEVYAIFQAIKFIEGSLIKKGIEQKFLIKTDCSQSESFIKSKNKQTKIFSQNLELAKEIKTTYERVKKRLAIKGCSFNLTSIPRKSNNIAHKYTYKLFKSIKKKESEIILIDKKAFLELMQKNTIKHYKVISHLFQISNEQKIIQKTQQEIAQSTEMSANAINKIFKELIKINILAKVKNGEYNLLI